MFAEWQKQIITCAKTQNPRIRKYFYQKNLRPQDLATDSVSGSFFLVNVKVMAERAYFDTELIWNVLYQLYLIIALCLLLWFYVLAILTS